MKPNVFHKPSDAKGWIMVVAVLVIVALGLWPVIMWVENPDILILGLNVAIFWPYLIVAITCIVFSLYECTRKEED